MGILGAVLYRAKVKKAAKAIHAAKAKKIVQRAKVNAVKAKVLTKAAVRHAIKAAS
jgi:hypothetical protein